MFPVFAHRDSGSYSRCGGDGGWGAYRYVPPQRVWFVGSLVWNQESFSRELRERVNVKKKKSPDRRLVCIVFIPNERPK